MESKPITVSPALAIAQLSNARAIALALLENGISNARSMETLLQNSVGLQTRTARSALSSVLGIVKRATEGVRHFAQRGRHYDRLLRDAVALGLYQHISARRRTQS